jgi:transposase InsO family protein
MLTILKTMLTTAASALKTRRELALENLALRQQLACFKATRARPRIDVTDRIFWVALHRLWHGWRASLHMVGPETVIRWHRAGFRRFWAWKSRRRTGRPAIPRQTRNLIRQLSRDNPTWGAPRIQSELAMLGVQVSQSTVARYMVKTKKPPSQTWRTFLDNHASDLVSIDFFTVPTATFEVLYAFLILSHDRRKLVHFNVTDRPTAEWTAHQITEGFPYDTAPKYLIRDRDAIYGHVFRNRLKAMGINEVVTAPRSPWQNAHVERVIGTLRRECLDHVIVLNRRHLVRILREYLGDYYHLARTHLSLGRDSPTHREIEPPDKGEIVEHPVLGGLHHVYSRRAAA